MVFRRISDIFSAATESTVAIPFMSIRLSLPDHTVDDRSSIKPAGHKTSLRHAASLQDLSAYRRLDMERGDLGFGIDKGTHTLLRENGGASFSKDKSLPGGAPFLKRKWVRAFFILLCLLLLGFFTYMIATSVYSYWFEGASKFYVVLDCGSTGTRVYVYQASMGNGHNGSMSIDIKPLKKGFSRRSDGHAYDRMETEPGLHMLVRNTSGLKAAINPLVHWAKKQIPKHAHKTTSLFLYATAGVRRLPEADSKWLFDNSWSILNESPFLCHREWIRIISGMEEAYYGWIALNYQRGMLGSSPKKATLGALDMGGSSLQVTFESENQWHNESTLNLKIGGVNHLLNAYSLAGYGLNDAFDKSVAYIVNKLPGADLVSGNITIKHPCLHYGYKELYTCSQCSRNQQGSVGPVMEGRNLGMGVKPGIDVQLIGAPNWEECRELARIAVNLSEWSSQSSGLNCDLQPCALPDSLPRPYGQFYAISGFFVVYRFFNLSSEAALDDLLEKGQEFCEKTWDIARTSVRPQPFIEQYCFRAPYIVLLLREGLHITDKQVTIGSGSVTWSLGVALLESGKAFSPRSRLHSYEILQMKIHPRILIALLFISLILLACALSCIGNWTPKFFRRPYLPLFRQNGASATSVLSIPSPFPFQRWNPINTGDGKVKTPLSPTIADSQQKPFGFGRGGLSSSGIQLMESSQSRTSGGVSHSYSSSSLPQMIESGNMASFWAPHRSKMRLQSRRSQSREDLSSSLTDAHMVKV